MRVTAAVLAILGLCVAALPAVAQRPARGGVCDPTISQHVQLSAIASDPAAWLGKCVTIPGIYNDERVYADADAIYGLNPNSIGGYVDGRGANDGFWTGEFTGRIADCKKAAADIESGLLRSPGILIDDSRQAGCKIAEGQFLLFMSQGELQPAKLTRRLPGAKGGDLAPAPKDWPELEAVKKLAADFAAAFRAKDKGKLAQLTGNAYAAEMLLAGGSAIDDLAKPGDHPFEVFLSRGSDASNAGAEACTCRTKDCSKLWPIARRDADNQETRPYACLAIDGMRSDGAWTWFIDASRDANGLPEGR